MAKSASLRIAVTGATRGLGRVLVERFVELGHVVAGCGRSGRHVDDLRRSHPAPHHFAVVDVAGEDQVRAWADEVLKAGPPDLLLNNAAVMNRNAPLWQISAEEFGRLIDVNVKGVANVIRAFAPAMIARKIGVIVNFSSGWGRSTSPEVAPYCCSKWAIEGLSKALAQELPAGLAAVALNPGIIDTEMLRESFGDDAANYPEPSVWVDKAAPFILALGPRDNGKSLSVPQ